MNVIPMHRMQSVLSSDMPASDSQHKMLFIIAPCRALISAPSGALYVTMHIFLSDFHDTDIGAVSTGWVIGEVERKDVKLGLQKT